VNTKGGSRTLGRGPRSSRPPGKDHCEHQGILIHHMKLQSAPSLATTKHLKLKIIFIKPRKAFNMFKARKHLELDRNFRKLGITTCSKHASLMKKNQEKGIKCNLRFAS
jgi:hypothetical protein